MVFMTTLFYVIKMNWLCALGIIPFYIICKNTLYNSGTAFKEITRCWHNAERGVRINQGEIMTGGATIRAINSQDFAEKVNFEGNDGAVLAQFVMITIWQWFSM